MSATATGSYDWITLDDDEEILWDNSPPLITEASSIATGVGMCLTLVLLPFGLLWIGSAYLAVQNREYVVTNKKFYKKTGILSTSTEQMPLGNLQNLSYSQSFFGGVFEFGTVEVSDASDTIAYTNVKSPQEVKGTLTELANDYGGQYGSGGSAAPALARVGVTLTGDVDRLYEELQQANETLEQLQEP